MLNHYKKDDILQVIESMDKQQSQIELDKLFKYQSVIMLIYGCLIGVSISVITWIIFYYSPVVK